MTDELPHWSRCNVTSVPGHVAGHVAATLNMTETGHKRDQNVIALETTWPETWPATWSRTASERGPFTINVAGNVAGNAGHVCGHVHYFFTFFIFSSFFCASVHIQSQTLFAKVRTLKIQIPFVKIIFSSKFSKHEIRKSGFEKPLNAPNWLT